MAVENKSTPCVKCNNSSENGPINPALCVNCPDFNDWKKKNTAP